MEPLYVLTESTVKPLSIEVGTDTVYLRKDITEESRADMEGKAVKYWKYQEAKMTPEEFNDYSAILNTQSVVQLVTGQENASNSQMIIMDAIADLYETIATMIS